jgi:3-isopropylmalate dehydrogenase
MGMSEDNRMSLDPSLGAVRLAPILPGWDASPSARSRLVIGLLSGDGIGPEVVGAARCVLAEIERHESHSFEIREAPPGEAGLSPLMCEFFSEIFAAGGAVLCGAKGGRFVYELRAHFNLYCKLVPIRPQAALRGIGVLRPEATENVDVLIIRENTAGLYLGEYGFDVRDGRRRAFHGFEYSEVQVARIIQVAIGAAQRRRRHLCVVTKPGGVPSISALWAEQAGLGANGSGVELRFLEVDTAAYQLLADAKAFDVVVAPNMFGDVLADGAALLLGSRGMSCSANLGDGGRGVFQTGHGAAYDLAGSDRANPLGQIHALGLLLRESFGLEQLALQLQAAIEDTLAAGWRTPDIAAPGSRVVGTQQLAEHVAVALGARLAPARQRLAAVRSLPVTR